jgi:hypothetical protein
MAPIFVVSTKCIDPCFLEFVVSNNTGNNQLVNGISLDFHFRGLIKVDNEISEKENLTINNDLTVCACTLSYL